jgi:hypothetical protein
MKENEWYVSYMSETCLCGFREWWDVCNDGTVERFHCDSEHEAEWLKDALNVKGKDEEAAKSPVVEFCDRVFDVIDEFEDRMNIAEVAGVLEICKAAALRSRSIYGEQYDD